MSKLIIAATLSMAALTLGGAGLLLAQEATTQPSTRPVRAADEKDPVKRSAAIMRQMHARLMMYCIENRGHLPAEITKLSPYLPAQFFETLQNPRTGAKPGYEYVWPGKSIPRIKEPHTVPLMWELTGDGKRLKGGFVLYTDGHVEPDTK